MASYSQLATDIIAKVGGAENVTKVIHCITRLRFTLKDKDKADTAGIEALSGVLGAVYNANLDQYQVIIGQAVEDVYNEVIAQLPGGETDATNEAEDIPAGGKKNPIVHAFQVVIGTITGSMIPIIGLLAAGGMINGLLNIFTKGDGLINLIDPNSPTKTIISTMAMVPFYFLPVLVGFSAARQLAPKDTSLQYIAAAVGGTMIAPAIRNIASLDNPVIIAASKTVKTAAQAIASSGVTAHGATAVANYNSSGTIQGWTVTAGSVAKFLGVTFNTSYFGIPVNLPSYAYTIFPIIVAVAIAKPLNAWLKKVLPLALRPIFQPMITFFITSSIVLLLVGPVISTLSSALSNVINFFLNLNLGIAGLIVGGFYQCLVIFGLHWLIVPIISQQIATTGQSNLNMIVSFTMLAQGVGALTIFFKSKRADLKGLALPSAISAFCGVTEPAMYGINLRYIRIFIMSSIGAAVGAAIGGFMNLHMYGFAGSLIGFPMFSAKGVTNPTTGQWVPGNPHNFLIFWIATIVCIVVTFALVWLFGYKDTDAMGKSIEKKNIFKDAVTK